MQYTVCVLTYIAGMIISEILFPFPLADPKLKVFIYTGGVFASIGLCTVVDKLLKIED